MTERQLAIVVAVLVVAAVVVPFTFLASVQRIAGAFLFWIVFSLAVIALIVRATASWRDDR